MIFRSPACIDKYINIYIYNKHIILLLTSASPNNLPCTLSDNAVSGVQPLDHLMLDPSLDTRRFVLNDSLVCSI